MTTYSDLRVSALDEIYIQMYMNFLGGYSSTIIVGVRKSEKYGSVALGPMYPYEIHVHISVYSCMLILVVCRCALGDVTLCITTSSMYLEVLQYYALRIATSMILVP